MEEGLIVEGVLHGLVDHVAGNEGFAPYERVFHRHRHVCFHFPGVTVSREAIWPASRALVHKHSRLTALGGRSPFVGLLLLVRKYPVANPGFSHQMAWPNRVILQLIAQLLHVNPQVMCVLLMRRSPNLGQKLPVRYH